MLPNKFPRLTVCLVISVVLFIAALLVQNAAPGNILAVTIYKAHMASLAGWIGYWLDRWLFPYSRPHVFMDEAQTEYARPLDEFDKDGRLLDSLDCAQMAMLRRAIIVAACLIAICLGA